MLNGRFIEMTAGHSQAPQHQKLNAVERGANAAENMQYLADLQTKEQ